MSIPYWHVDAFASRPFTGNQAAVLLFDCLPGDDQLATIAAENMFGATAFLTKEHAGEADYAIRWFSPTSEIGLCGHGTLAAGHVILNKSGNESISFLTNNSKILEVRRANAGYEMCLPAIPTTQSERPGIGALLGAAPQEIWLSPDHYGIYLFEDEQQLRALQPDFTSLAELGNEQFICTAPGNSTDIVSRVFVPGGGTNEDSVTGSAHSALASFWADRLRRNNFTAHQASQRGGDLALRLDRKASGDLVWLGGNCVTVAEGQYHLSG